jgi:hypothetical protein
MPSSYACQLNGPDCTRRATEVDHRIPVSQGGAMYDQTNLQAACFNCNRSKGGGTSAAACAACGERERHPNGQVLPEMRQAGHTQTAWDSMVSRAW